MNDDTSHDPDQKRRIVLALYASLKGIERAWPTTSTANGLILKRASDIITEACDALSLDRSKFLPPSSLIITGHGEPYFLPGDARPFIQQFLTYLEMVEHAAERIQEVGSLFNVIKHEELKKRCSDLLSSPGPFDRAINQATLVLEDCIRQKVVDKDGLSGTQLAGKYIKTDPSSSPLVVSQDNSQQEGFSNLVKGLMLMFRNETHHQISDKFGREEALQICGFIDNAISLIENATYFEDR